MKEEDKLIEYDSTSLESSIPKKKLSEKQKAGIEKAKETRKKKRDYRNWRVYRGGKQEIDRAKSVRWARKVLAENYLVIHGEGTALSRGELVEIAVLNLRKEVVFYSLIKPKCAIPEKAIAIHGITNQEVRESPRFIEIWPSLAQVIKGRALVTYSDYIVRSLRSHLTELKIPVLEELEQSEDLMEEFARWYGDYNEYHNEYYYQSLERQRAKQDCETIIDRLYKMGTDDPLVKYPSHIQPPEEEDDNKNAFDYPDPRSAVIGVGGDKPLKGYPKEGDAILGDNLSDILPH